MNDPGLNQSDDQVRFLRNLMEEHASIAGDVVQVGDTFWAIHGFISVDGDVLMAGFDSYERATSVLEQLPRLTPWRDDS